MHLTLPSNTANKQFAWILCVCVGDQAGEGEGEAEKDPREADGGPQQASPHHHGAQPERGDRTQARVQAGVLRLTYIIRLKRLNWYGVKYELYVFWN